MKRFLIMVILVGAALFGCGKKAEPVQSGYPVEFNQVVVDKKPKRVVSLSKSVTEKLTVLGYKNKIVGDSTAFADANFPKTEEITALNPDMVISGAPLSPTMTEELGQLGIKILIFPYTENEEELYSLWGGICRVFEGSDTGAIRENQIRYFGAAYDKYLNEAAANEIQENYTDAPPRALVASYMDYAATPDTLTGEWLNNMGFLNAALNYTGWYAPIKEIETPYILFFPMGEEELFSGVSVDSKIPYDLDAFENQSPKLFLARYDMLKAAFPQGEFSQPDCIMPLPIPPPPPLKWYEKIFAKF